MKYLKMRLYRRLVSLLLFLAMCCSVANAQNPNFHIYLAFGQSNMEGQGEIQIQDKTVPDNFKVLWSANNSTVYGVLREKGKWYPATPPLAHNSGAKLSVADYFGRTLADKLSPNITIGIINVSMAGASIQLFDKNNYQSYINKQQDWFKQRVQVYDNNPYGRLIEMAKLAQKDGVIKGIIMHQGETDASDAEWPNKVKAVYDNIINDLGLGDDIPLLAGEVLRTGVGSAAIQLIAKLPKQSKNFYVVTSQGFNQALGDGQNLHFTTQEYRDFGKRYADMMIEILGDKLSPVSAVVTGMEQVQGTKVSTPSTFYSLDGMQQPPFLPGITIMKNGRKVKKILTK